jgi:hypothetical protein
VRRAALRAGYGLLNNVPVFYSGCGVLLERAWYGLFNNVPVSTLACGVLLERAWYGLLLACRFRCVLACCWSVPPCRDSEFGVLLERAWNLLLRFGVLFSVPGSYCANSGLACFLACLAPIVLTQVWRAF